MPAAIAVVDGRLRVGLGDGDLERIAAGAIKVSSRDLGPAVAHRDVGATTVAATMRVAAMAGIRFFATGGIGGVHRGHPEDQSADLVERGADPLAFRYLALQTRYREPTNFTWEALAAADRGLERYRRQMAEWFAGPVAVPPGDLPAGFSGGAAELDRRFREAPIFYGLFGGGIIPEDDARELKTMGVVEVFGPGTSLQSIISFVNKGFKAA